MAIKTVGSLWTHKDKEGKLFMSGVIDMKDQEGKNQVQIEDDKIHIFVFVNKYKKKDTKQPGFKVCQKQDDDEGGVF
jgi:hypothetical protein